ncbi:NAD(P)H-binding protein [Streptomyces turgidiscabies]|uniref:NAD(P)-binding domain-containing protein n=1 Tax=Streptomyces turgidiscabies (strain Car8) TaxID=698760 RepID=L7EXU1_STRT8|nr:NAD(P)H-binding protein [Streptomyces turgidiscabies]ELP63200.1 hypothetical protein STRTUCAR8_00530 [Streptomyces turgidiscabies Car8]MDX3499669.1 NAD(P)H-binding protein [Streptomyces turgidiscabies]GAQ73387.1 hypothetical protein T45_05145 [Streptomyces turgidiscabies]
MSRIVVFGAAGKAGSRVIAEAAARGHKVTAVARDIGRLGQLPEGLRPVTGDGDAQTTCSRAKEEGRGTRSSQQSKVVRRSRRHDASLSPPGGTRHTGS